MDWNSDGDMDIVSGDRDGYFNFYVMRDSVLEPHLQMQLMDMTILDVGYNSQPAVVDWNGDGKKDLLLGTEEGYVRFYENQTLDTWPMFLPFDTIEAGGRPIYYNRVNPYVFDLDLDGVQDLICGANDGYVHFYRNSGTNAEPVLEPEESLRTVAGTAIQPSGSYPAGSRCGFGDWNNDEVPDFLISGYEGYVELYLGTLPVGTAEERTAPAKPRLAPRATVVRNFINLAGTAAAARLLDATGRPVMRFVPGKNDISRLVAGTYFIRSDGQPTSGTQRVVISR